MHKIYMVMRPTILFQLSIESLLITLQPFLTVLVRHHEPLILYTSAIAINPSNDVLIYILESQQRHVTDVTRKYKVNIVFVNKHPTFIRDVLFILHDR